MLRKKKLLNLAVVGFAMVLLLGGFSVLFLLFVPRLSAPKFLPASSIDLNILDDAQDRRDRIEIPKMDLEVPFQGGSSPQALEQGAWHRFPDRGDPVKGGNFILSAHRFSLALTPGQTRTKSPFYNLQKLVVGDGIKVFFQGKTYDYKVTRIYDVKPDDSSIEAPSQEAKMTLYSCTLKGSADGRYVIEAKIVTP